MKDYKSPFYPHIKRLEIMDGKACTDCGRQVFFAYCTTGNYAYCSNKVCNRHGGAGRNQGQTSWIKDI